MLDRFLSALSVVSRIPVKLPHRFDPSRVDFYLPVTGIFPALIGFLVFTAFSGVFDAPQGGGRILAVIITLILQYLAFNLFHLDGLMDTADAFLGTRDKEKRLAVLKDPAAGVYGFFAGFAALSLKAALLYTLFPKGKEFPALVFMFPLWGRWGGALVPALGRPLNPASLGGLVKDARAGRATAGLGLGLVFFTLLVQGPVTVVRFAVSLFSENSFALFFEKNFERIAGGALFHPALIAVPLLCVLSPLCALYYNRLYTKSLGGYTGDAIGAAIETTEILAQGTVLAALWAAGSW